MSTDNTGTQLEVTVTNERVDGRDVRLRNSHYRGPQGVVRLVDREPTTKGLRKGLKRHLRTTNDILSPRPSIITRLSLRVTKSGTFLISTSPEVRSGTLRVGCFRRRVWTVSRRYYHGVGKIPFGLRGR